MAPAGLGRTTEQTEDWEAIATSGKAQHPASGRDEGSKGDKGSHAWAPTEAAAQLAKHAPAALPDSGGSTNMSPAVNAASFCAARAHARPSRACRCL